MRIEWKDKKAVIGKSGDLLLVWRLRRERVRIINSNLFLN